MLSFLWLVVNHWRKTWITATVVFKHLDSVPLQGPEYYDKKLSGPISMLLGLFLILIYEQEELNMRQLAQRAV